MQRFRVRPEFQLFDLNEDPNELDNLVSNPEYASKVSQLQGEIEDWMAEQGDTGVKRR